ncbi:MAG: HTTM domain-containing protein [Alphaproteobacteria bacterium]|nr:HTTM domain-containing protein [Alphaproteobacteria bacterium]
MSAAWTAWVRLWAEREHPRSLALVRILLGSCITWDLLQIRWYGLVTALFGVQQIGGLSDALTRANTPLWYRVVPGTEFGAFGLHTLMLMLALSLTLGFFTRSSALLLLLAWGQFADIVPAADRGIDTLCRDVLMLFVFAEAGRWCSLDALVRTGSIWGDGQAVGAWARKLLVLQIVAMYFLAGIQKTGMHWWPPGHFAALYFILQDPAIARIDFSWLEKQPFFLLTQLGSLGTLVFQDSYPIVLLLRYWRSTPEKGGRLRTLANRHPWLEWVWIGTGAVFHLLLAATCELGIFPWAMLALYPAWVHPDDWSRLFGRTAVTAAPST